MNSNKYLIEAVFKRLSQADGNDKVRVFHSLLEAVLGEFRREGSVSKKALESVSACWQFEELLGNVNSDYIISTASALLLPREARDTEFQHMKQKHLMNKIKSYLAHT